MKLELKVNKEQLMVIGNGAKKIGKAIIVEGTKAVVLKGTQAVVMQSFDRTNGGIKSLKLDDLLGGGKKKPKKALFSFKKNKKTDGTLEAEVEIEAVTTEVVEPVTVKTK